jgi:tetratricopeptide (TPR) repeat protein
LHRGADSRIAGFYRTNASGSIAVVPRTLARGSFGTSDTVFFHEYAHHLMFQDFDAPYPPWFVEGFAEFMSTAEVKADGSVGLGGAAVHRAGALYRTRNSFPFTAMLGAERPRTTPERGALYARGWLLAHYLTFSPKRRGQLESYLTGMANGAAPIDAAKSAFGDLTALERETENYLRADKFPYLTLPHSQISIGAVTVEPVSPGNAAIMPLLMRLKAGTDNANRAGLAAEVRKAAMPFPRDPSVQVVLAEAELIAGDPRAAEDAADRAVAANPRHVEALILKGRAVMARAAATQAGAGFVDARNWFMRANKVDPEDPEPLILFYQSYRAQKVQPTKNAIAALHYAASLAPQDSRLRLDNARQYLSDGEPSKARKALIPLAYNPHGGPLSDEARRLIQSIDSGTPPQR